MTKRLLLLALVAMLPSAIAVETIQSQDIAPGESWSHTLKQDGTFDYHNHLAPAIEGKITIGHASGAPQTHTIAFDGDAFEPAQLNALDGDTITWVNNADAAMRIMGWYGGGHSHDDHSHGDGHTHGPEEESPGLPLAALLAGLAILARRR